MEMTNEEIVRSYRLPLFPKKQITILAELNLCSRAQIVQILIEGGVDPNELPRLPKYQRGSAYVQTNSTRKKGGGRHWVWKQDQSKPADELIQQARDHYEKLKKDRALSDTYLMGFKACLDLLK